MTQETQVGAAGGPNVACERTEPTRHPEFAVHMLNDAGKVKANEIREEFDFLLTRLGQLCTPGREFSIAKTKLEEACFFAKKAMAINLGNQQH